MPSDSIAEEEDEIKVGGFSLQNLSCCYDENFEIPFDVVLEVSDGHKVEELKAHQFVLALHSDVLEEKIRSSVKSKSTTPIRLQFQCEDIEVLKVLIKFCYNIIDPMFDKTLRFLIAVYREAEKFNIVELQELVLKHRTFTGSASSSQVKVFQHVVDLALKNLTSPRLAEALFHKAGKMIPDTRLTPLYMMKYQ